MAATVKVDLLGSTLTEGREARFDRAVRRAFVRGLNALDPSPTGDPTEVHLKEAIKAVLAEVGEYHNLELELPIERIQAVKFGDDSAFVRIIYSRRIGGFDDDPPENVATITTSLESTHLYRASTRNFQGNEVPQFDQFGLPNGDMWKMTDVQLQDEEFQPQERIFKRPVRRIWVRQILRNFPFYSVDRLVGKVNSNPLTFGGVIMNIYTVRFDGYTSRYFVSNDERFFDIQYLFTWLPEGHYHHKPFFNGIWTTVAEIEYEAADFGGVFSP